MQIGVGITLAKIGVLGGDAGVGLGISEDDEDMPLPYISNVIYPLNNLTGSANPSVANQDTLMPFIPHSDVTIDGVAWVRDIGTAANVYVGVYSAAGALLTNCAVDADVTPGTHVVSCTAVALLKNTKYYFAWNASADCASGRLCADAASTYPREYGIEQDLAAAANLGATLASFPTSYGKARTNAALLSTLTMSGFTAASLSVAMGFRPV